VRGRFITFEGGEGVGKSTQVERLKRRLEAEGFDVVATREPGGSPKAERIREVLLGGGAKRFGPLGETMLFCAARADHLEQRIRPALERGAFVLCDRFADSTRAYQGALGDVDPAVLSALERIVVGETRPDLTLVLDAPAALGLARASARRGNGDGGADRFESEERGFHERLRQAFLDIAEHERDRCVVVDASTNADVVEAAIWGIVESRLLGGRRPAAPSRRALHGV
jgi:dTMP kinase